MRIAGGIPLYVGVNSQERKYMAFPMAVYKAIDAPEIGLNAKDSVARRYSKLVSRLHKEYKRMGLHRDYEAILCMVPRRSGARFSYRCPGFE
jgi:hypothetical protein